MFHSWRRWSLPTFLSLTFALTSSAFAVDHAADAAQLLSDDPAACQKDAQQIVENNAKITSIVDRDADAGDIAKNLGPVTESSTNHNAALNAAIAVARLKSISTEKTLESMLTNPDATIRYWAAKGLGDLLPMLKPLPTALKRATDSLNTALDAEKDDIVRAALQRALGKPVVPAASTPAGGA